MDSITYTARTTLPVEQSEPIVISSSVRSPQNGAHRSLSPATKAEIGRRAKQPAGVVGVKLLPAP